jgi:hypothetical protein
MFVTSSEQVRIPPTRVGGHLVKEEQKQTADSIGMILYNSKGHVFIVPVQFVSTTKMTTRKLEIQS